MYRIVGLSFCLCELLAFISVSVLRHHTMFILVMVIHMIVYFVLLSFSYVLEQFTRLSDTTIYGLAFFVSYTIFHWVFWKLDGSKDVMDYLVDVHGSRDFWAAAFPFLVANTAAIVFLKVYKKPG